MKATHLPQSLGFMILPSIILPFIFLFGMGLCLFEHGRIIRGRMMKMHSDSPEFAKLESLVESVKMVVHGKMGRMPARVTDRTSVMVPSRRKSHGE